MRSARKARSKTQRERGYALLLVIFLTTLMLLGVMAVGPNVFTEGQREREEEMIWRGNQYVRGIKLFYRKTGRFPPALQDLTEPKMGVRFLRKAYTDPMNTKDGSWRLIYVGPGGALIGSVNQNQSPLQFPLAGGTPPGGTQGGGQPSSGTGPAAQGAAAARDQQVQSPGTSSAGARTDQSGFGFSPGTVFGGNIIGVGSKVNRTSIKVYERGRKYSEWEFIWDPRKDVAPGGQPGMQTGAGIGQPIGTPTGQTPQPKPPQPANPPNPPPPNPLPDEPPENL